MMFRLSRRLLLNLNKTTTGLVGLDVVPNAREVLISLYERTMEITKAYPKDLYYNGLVYNLSKYRLRTLLENRDDDVAARTIGVENLEELIRDAEDELELLDELNNFKPTETPDPDWIKHSPPMFGVNEHGGSVQLFPLPPAVQAEIDTGKVSLFIDDPKRPVSVTLLKHMGITPTPEQIAAAEAALKLTPEEEAAVAARREAGVNSVRELMESFFDPTPIPEDLLNAQRHRDESDTDK